ncbi:MAG: L-glutamate gamma-semialdehyde dehydrogenase [Myxococcota bacterium]
MHGRSQVPAPRNEPPRLYGPGSPEKAPLKAAVAKMAERPLEVPLWIDGRAVTHAPVNVTSPHEHHRVVGLAHTATAAHVQQAIEAAETARPAWAELDYEHRAAVFLKAADLVCGPYRDRINAATMLGQSKTAHQSEIDAVCELADFWRFNVGFGQELMEEQPWSPKGMWNYQELRPLDGFVFAITPFNFTAIAGNLPTAPALMGNTVLWKPAPTQMVSAQVIVEILQEAGLPRGVINMVAGDPALIGEVAMSHPKMAGLHFTGSTRTFQHLWSQVGQNIGRYASYPRIVGETGGKDFIFIHPSASNVQALSTAIIRGAFEYQGQKCSAASRVYVPKSVWSKLEPVLLDTVATLKTGDVQDFRNFMGAVIDERSFKKIKGYVDEARAQPDYEIRAGGTYDDGTGWFVQPTVVLSRSPESRLMREEIFGPVVTLFVYEDAELEATLDACDANPYALTGAIFADDRRVVAELTRRLRGAAGNFYINDKPTGSVVGQQPFGGSRASGTNDKAGSAANLMRWVSTRAVKETLVPPTDYRYPFLEES